VLGENVSQTFQFVRTGNADAGVVALSLAIGTPGTRYSVIDAALHEPIAQAAGVLARTRQSAAAREFLAFVNGPSGRPLMRKYGFTLPGEG
jgi:molybdate transport system substrate-binding protein